MAIIIISQVRNVQNNCGNIGICNRAGLSVVAYATEWEDKIF